MRCYVDYTCGHSFRVWSWLRTLDVDVDWRTFSLKEVNRAADAPRAFDDTGSISVLALALAHAARDHDFLRYHAAAFDGFQDRHLTRDELLGFAADAGVPIDRLDPSRLIAQVRDEHDEARTRWGMFGTPTIIDDDSVAFLRLVAVPAGDDALPVWLHVRELARTDGGTIHIDSTSAAPAR